MMDATGFLVVFRRPRRPTLLVRENGDQPTVAGIEVEMALSRVVEIRLLEHERHPEDAFPEVDRRLPFRTDECDVVDALALELLHLARGECTRSRARPKNASTRRRYSAGCSRRPPVCPASTRQSEPCAARA